ncbi:MAG: hypothetical protein RSD74_02075 [Angelakisella sp.]
MNQKQAKRIRAIERSQQQLQKDNQILHNALYRATVRIARLEEPLAIRPSMWRRALHKFIHKAPSREH